MTRLTVVALGLFVFTTNVFAAGYEFEGIGVNEVSRGGAAIASVDNWTAIYWNPARLAANHQKQFGGEFWCGYSNSYDGNSLSLLAPIPFSKKEMTADAYLGAWGAVLPIQRSKISIGFGMYTPLLQGVSFEDTSLLGHKVKLQNRAGIIAANFSAGWEISPALSLGLGTNIVRAETKLKLNMENPNTDSYWNAHGWGNEGTFGIHWKISEQLALGAVYRSGTIIPIETQAQASASGYEEKTNLKYDFVYPPTAGVGLSYQLNPRYLLSLDLNRTFWSKFKDAIDFEQDGLLLKDRKNSFDWKDTSKLRIGGSFQWTRKTQILAGYSFDQYAIDSKNIDFSTAIDVNMSRFSAGLNQQITETVAVGLGFVYGQGKRKENYSGEEVIYKLSGGQLMTELRYNF